MKLTYKVFLILVILSLPASVLAGSDYGYKQKAMDTMRLVDIVDTAKSAGTFNTLVQALKAADLVATLKGEGPFTVFAPTDAAFAKLPADTLSDLMRPENKAKLQSILTYHVVAGKVKSKNAAAMSAAKTVNGTDLSIQFKDGYLMVDNAKVIKADVRSSNGIIHVIDTVMMP